MNKKIVKFVIVLIIAFSLMRKSELKKYGIVNGKTTSITEYPWTASINYGNVVPLYASLTCGAIVISKKYRLTSAHCYEYYPFYVPGRLFVRAGTNYATWYGDKMSVAKWIIHEKYNATTRENDLAVIELTEEFKSDVIKSIEMVEKDFNITDDLVVKAAGFGKTCSDCSGSYQLMEVVQTT